MTDLHYLPATQALQAFRDRELSPVELVTAVIDRAEAVEPVINAFAETFYARALEASSADIIKVSAALSRDPGPASIARAAESVHSEGR